MKALAMSLLDGMMVQLKKLTELKPHFLQTLPMSLQLEEQLALLPYATLFNIKYNIRELTMMALQLAI